MKTDVQIRREVIEALEWEPAVNSQHVGVDVRHGILTLYGQVGSHAEKLNAESAARRVHGVKALAVAIDVRLAGIAKRRDADIARSVTDLLTWTVYLPAGAVQVVVEGGWVTLTGQVEWNYPRSLAMNAVRSLGGVVGVSDETVTKPSAALSAIKSVIEAARRHRPDSRVTALAADMRSGEVTLSGAVRSWFERDAPSASPRGTRGVCTVVDCIAVH